MSHRASWTAEAWLILAVNAVPWLLVVAGWLWLRTGFAATTDFEHFWGPEAYWNFLGVFAIAWLVSGVALGLSIWRLWAQKLALVVCVGLNGLILVVPLVFVAWIRLLSTQ